MKTKEARFFARQSDIGSVVAFAEENLGKHASKKDKVKLLLTLEELLVQLVDHAAGPESGLRIRISGGKKRKVTVSCVGAPFTLESTQVAGSYLDMSCSDEEQAQILSSIVLKLYADRVKLRHTKGINRVEMILEPEKKSNPIFAFLGAGVLFGLFLRFFVPTAVNDFLLTNVITAISDIFLNGIKALLVPLVFFSIAESMCGFSDLSSFGRLGGKVIGMYLLTTTIAIAVGYAAFCLFQPGSPDLMPEIIKAMGNAETVPVGTFSIRDLLVNIVPGNLFESMLNADMLQILCCGIVVGIACGLLGSEGQGLQNFLHTGNALFLKISSLLSSCMPVVVFCVIVNMTVTTSVEMLMSMLKVYGTFLAAIAGIVACYMLLLVLFTRANPLNFFKKYAAAITVAFSTCSSCAAMPTSMNCLDDLGVSSDVYRFSIPLGATINMDGSSICYLVTTLFLARIFGINVSGSTLFALFLTVLLLSIGTPSGAAVSALSCNAMLLAMVGVPTAAVSFLLPLLPFTDFVETASNVTGDAVVTAIVAKSEGMLDMNKYSS